MYMWLVVYNIIIFINEKWMWLSLVIFKWENKIKYIIIYIICVYMCLWIVIIMRGFKVYYNMK